VAWRARPTQSESPCRASLGVGAALGLPTAAIIVILAPDDHQLGGHALPSQDAFRVIMAIGCGAALLALALASFLPRHRRPAIVDGTEATIAESRQFTPADIPARPLRLTKVREMNHQIHLTQR